MIVLRPSVTAPPTVPSGSGELPDVRRAPDVDPDSQVAGARHLPARPQPGDLCDGAREVLAPQSVEERLRLSEDSRRVRPTDEERPVDG